MLHGSPWVHAHSHCHQVITHQQPMGGQGLSGGHPGITIGQPTLMGIGSVWVGPYKFSLPPPPLVVPHPLSFPRGGWGTVTWSTQNFSLRLIVLLCG